VAVQYSLLMMENGFSTKLIRAQFVSTKFLSTSIGALHSTDHFVITICSARFSRLLPHDVDDDLDGSRRITKFSRRVPHGRPG
jgi:hypothetical protein